MLRKVIHVLFMFMIAAEVGATTKHVDELLPIGGGVDSGGGEIIRHSQNPWFLQNTEKVNYCLQIDEANFGVSRDIALNSIEFAFNYWKKEFASIYPTTFAREDGQGQPYEVKVATQEFVYQSECDVKVDLIFDFGAFEAPVAGNLFNPRKLAGVSRKIAYSKSKLKAKGFIYLSPEAGPLSFVQSGVVEKPWSSASNIRLKLTLMHELGHVFGIAHSKRTISLMGIGYVDQLMGTDSTILETFSKRVFRSYFLPEKNIDFHYTCQESPTRYHSLELNDLFDFSKEWLCTKLVVEDYEYKVLGKKSHEDSEWTTLAEGRFDSKDQQRVAVQVSPYLDTEQTVYDHKVRTGYHDAYSSYRHLFSELTPTGSMMLVEISPDGYSLSAVHKGKYTRMAWLE